MGRTFLTGTRSLLAGFAAAMTLLVVIVGGTYAPALAQDSTPADDAASPTAADCNVEQAVADAPTVYTIDSEASTASYVAQEELAKLEVTGNAGGGMVSVTLTGAKECRKIRIDPSLLSDAEMLEDLILAAVTEAMDNAQAMQQKMLGPLAGGLNLAGLG